MNVDHLLDQADHLADRQAVGRPRAVDLRRAVSAAYYAVFHTLTEAGAGRLHSDPATRHLLTRAFDHRTMKDAARQFANKNGRLWSFAASAYGSVQQELIRVAELFVKLQEARHQAEYDHRRASDFSRQETRDHADNARTLIRDWEAVRNTAQAQFFLLALLLKDLGRFAD